MKLIITADNRLHFRAIGSVEPQHWKNRSEEKLVVEIRGDDDSLIAIDSGTLKVALKATKETEEILARCTSFTAASNVHTGWLNLNTDECNALTNSEVLIEVSWEVGGHEVVSDDAKVWIIARTVTGDEASPVTTSALVTAEWLATHLLASAAFTWTPNTTTGTLTISPNFASEAQAEAGTNDTLLMNPLRVAQAIAALASTGSGAWADITGKPSNLCLVTNSEDGLFVEFRDLSGTLITKVLRVAE